VPVGRAQRDGLRALVIEVLPPRDASAAAIYYRMRTELAMGPAWEARPRVAVEVGGGPGGAARVLSRIPGVRLCIGLDLSRSYLLAAKQPEYPIEPIQATADGTLPLKSGRVDFVLASEVFEHLRNRTRFIAEVHRILRPGGTFVLTTPNLQSVALVLLRRVPRAWARRILTRESPAHKGLHPEFFPEVLTEPGRAWHVVEGATLKELRALGAAVGLATVAAGTWGVPFTISSWDRLPSAVRPRVMRTFHFLPFGLRHVVIVFRKDRGRSPDRTSA